MIREWWNRQMDAQRAFSLVLGAGAVVLMILGLALAPGFLASGDHDGGGFAKYSAAFGGTFGFAARAFLLHRKSGIGNGLLWAVAHGGSMALFFVAMFAAATAISPIVSRSPTLGGDAWSGIMAIAIVLGLTFNLMWERNARRRRIAAVLLLAAGILIGGLIGLRSGGAWAVIGTLSLSAGIITLVVAIVQGLSELHQEMAETAA